MNQNRIVELLLVEDNEADVILTQESFKRAGLNYNIHVAYDGEDAIDYLKKDAEYVSATTPDLILLDINMPRMDGKEFLEIIKHDQDLKKIPVIMLTSSDSPRDIKDCYERYANAYLLKQRGLDNFIDMANQINNFWINLAKIPKPLV